MARIHIVIDSYAKLWVDAKDMDKEDVRGLQEVLGHLISALEIIEPIPGPSGTAPKADSK